MKDGYLVTPTEAQEQKIVVEWLRAKNIFFTHVPNGGKRSIVEAVNFKRMGVLAGIPDLLIFTPCRKHECRGIAIELKTKNGKVSEKQNYAIRELHKCGWIATACFGADDAIEFLEELGF